MDLGNIQEPGRPRFLRSARRTAVTCAAAGSSWADLQSDLLVSIADGLSLGDYACLRGVCAGWRSALVPPYPCLFSIHDAGRRPRSIFSLPLQRSNLSRDDAGPSSSIFSLPLQRSLDLRRKLYSGVDGCGRVLGSGNGLLAVGLDGDKWTARIFIVDPRAREEIVKRLPTFTCGGYESVRKVVLAPDPDDGTVVVVAMCGKTVAYIDTGSSEDMAWKTVEIIARAHRFQLADLAFHAAPGGSSKVYCLDLSGGVCVLRIPRRNRQEEPSLTVLSASVRAAFPGPYGVASELTFTKHLFFCHDNLYQVWQNNSATVRSGSWFTMVLDEIFILRQDLGHQGLCWNVVKDLGGCSVFVGKNSSPAVVGAGAIPGVRGDCVYWIDWRGKPMVCDVATGTSKPLVLSYGACKVSCWYFGGDNMTSNTNNKLAGILRE